MEQDWMRRVRFLTQAVILSGTLNIGLLSTFIYSSVKKKPHQESVREESLSALVSQKSNEQTLQAYSSASFTDLLLRLENKEAVEEGFYKRDLALSCLVAFHYFPVEKALGGAFLQKRRIAFRTKNQGEIVELMAFTGLTDEHFLALAQFAKTEKWPLTTKGLFWEIQKGNLDPSLWEAFYCTAEFHSLYILVQKQVPELSQPQLVALLKEGGWKILQQYADQLRLFQQYTPEVCREFLTACALQSGSKRAADCLCAHEKEYLIKRWEDSQLISLFDLYEVDKGKVQDIAVQLLLSQRSDGLRQRTALFLYSLAGETVPTPYSYEQAVQRFCPQPVIAIPEIFEASVPGVVQSISLPVEEKKKKIIHKVQERDSLWKIARQYGVSVDAIKKCNNLESDKLKIGRELEIPGARTSP